MLVKHRKNSAFTVLKKSMYIGRAPQTSQGNVDAVRSYTNRSELEYAFHVGYPV